MSSYSFSHQFYQHWMQAPEQIRAAIVQELTDITELLQTDTPFEKFVFNIHDLDTHLDKLYHAEDLKQADIQKQQQQAEAKEKAEKQAKLRAEVEQQHLEEERLKEERLEKRRLNAEKNAEAEKVQLENEASQQQDKDDKEKSAATVDSKINKIADINQNVDNNAQDSLADQKLAKAEVASSNQANNKENNQKDTVTTTNKTMIAKPNKGAAINLSPTDSKLSAGHESLIRELEMHVDDYLTEQMLQISEDLKSWLRSEVSRQLIEKVQASDGGDNKEE